MLTISGSSQPCGSLLQDEVGYNGGDDGGNDGGDDSGDDGGDDGGNDGGDGVVAEK